MALAALAALAARRAAGAAPRALAATASRRALAAAAGAGDGDGEGGGDEGGAGGDEAGGGAAGEADAPAGGAEAGAEPAEPKASAESDEAVRGFLSFTGFGAGALPNGGFGPDEPVAMPDPREDETLFDDLAIEDPRERRKAVRRERRRRFGGGEGGQPEKLAEGQNVWVERMKRNGKLIPYGQGIVDDWQQYELDEVSNEVHGDLSDFAGRVHDPERDEAFWNMYRKAIAELGSEIDRRASADRAVPARKVKRMLGTPFVRWTNVVATRTDGSASPMAKKVAAEFSVPDAAAHFGLTPEQELRMVELAGTRYNPRKRSIRIVSRRFRYREQNQRDIARIMVRLIAEARRAKPNVDTESIAASGEGEGEGGGIDEALLSAEAREERAAQLEEWYAHVRASVHAQEEAEAEGEAEALTAAEVEAEVGAELEAETASAEVPGAPVEADVAAEAAEAVTGEGDGLAALSRKELQALAKEHGLKANARSEELIKQLRAAGAKVPQ